MSYEATNATDLLGPFASNLGYGELIAAAGDDYPVLQSLFKNGATEDVSKAVEELRKLKGSEDAVTTAQALADLIEGQELVIITDGTSEEEDVAKAGDGIMIAWFPPAELAVKLAQDGGEKPEELHVTLAYLGKREAFTDDQVQLLKDTVENYCKRFAPLQGTLGGNGRFPATPSSDDKDVLIKMVDVAMLEKFREELIEELADKGISIVRNHGYTPHMTLAYVDPDYTGECTHPDTDDIVIDALTIAIGAERRVYPLNGEEVLKSNECHVPSGPAGGQFCGGGGGSRFSDTGFDGGSNLWLDAQGNRQLPKTSSVDLIPSPLKQEPDHVPGIMKARTKLLSGEDISRAPLKEVTVDDLYGWQAIVMGDKLKPFNSETAPPLRVVKWQDRLIVYDGNNRAAAAWASGTKTVKANVLDLDDPKNKKYIQLKYRSEVGKMEPTASQVHSDKPLTDEEKKRKQVKKSDLEVEFGETSESEMWAVRWSDGDAETLFKDEESAQSFYQDCPEGSADEPRLLSGSGLNDLKLELSKINYCHAPSGPTGGQFCSEGGGVRTSAIPAALGVLKNPYLRGAKEAVFNVLKDGQPHNISELKEAVGRFGLPAEGRLLEVVRDGPRLLKAGNMGWKITRSGDTVQLTPAFPKKQAGAKPGNESKPGEGKTGGLESSLRTASRSGVSDVSDLGGGVSVTRLVKFENGGKAVFKPSNGEMKDFVRENVTPGFQTPREVGAWEVAKLSGMTDLVCPVIATKIHGKDGALLAFQKGVDAYKSNDMYDGPRDLARSAVFDFVIGNEDRHGANWMMDGGKIRLIDHGLAFPDAGKFGTGFGNHKILERAQGDAYDKPSIHLPYFKEAAASYLNNEASILVALKKVGLPEKSVQGVQDRILALKNAASLRDLRAP